MTLSILSPGKDFRLKLLLFFCHWAFNFDHLRFPPSSEHIIPKTSARPVIPRLLSCSPAESVFMARSEIKQPQRYCASPQLGKVVFLATRSKDLQARCTIPMYHRKEVRLPVVLYLPVHNNSFSRLADPHKSSTFIAYRKQAKNGLSRAPEHIRTNLPQKTGMYIQCLQ